MAYQMEALEEFDALVSDDLRRALDDLAGHANLVTAMLATPMADAADLGLACEALAGALARLGVRGPGLLDAPVFVFVNPPAGPTPAAAPA